MYSTQYMVSVNVSILQDRDSILSKGETKLLNSVD